MKRKIAKTAKCEGCQQPIRQREPYEVYCSGCIEKAAKDLANRCRVSFRFHLGDYRGEATILAKLSETAYRVAFPWGGKTRIITIHVNEIISDV